MTLMILMLKLILKFFLFSIKKKIPVGMRSRCRQFMYKFMLSACMCVCGKSLQQYNKVDTFYLMLNRSNFVASVLKEVFLIKILVYNGFLSAALFHALN